MTTYNFSEAIFVDGTLVLGSKSHIVVQSCANLTENSTLVVGDSLSETLLGSGEVTVLVAGCLNGTFGHVKFSDKLSSCALSNIQSKIKDNNIVLVFNKEQCEQSGTKVVYNYSAMSDFVNNIFSRSEPGFDPLCDNYSDCDCSTCHYSDDQIPT